jgi:hypothetical protein
MASHARFGPAAELLLADADHLLAIRGDHTIALPLLRVARRKFELLALMLLGRT